MWNSLYIPGRPSAQRSNCFCKYESLYLCEVHLLVTIKAAENDEVNATGQGSCVLHSFSYSMEESGLKLRASWIQRACSKAVFLTQKRHRHTYIRPRALRTAHRRGESREGGLSHFLIDRIPQLKKKTKNQKSNQNKKSPTRFQLALLIHYCSATTQRRLCAESACFPRESALLDQAVPRPP